MADYLATNLSNTTNSVGVISKSINYTYFTPSLTKNVHTFIQNVEFTFSNTKNRVKVWQPILFNSKIETISKSTKNLYLINKNSKLVYSLDQKQNFAIKGQTWNLVNSYRSISYINKIEQSPKSTKSFVTVQIKQTSNALYFFT